MREYTREVRKKKKVNWKKVFLISLGVLAGAVVLMFIALGVFCHMKFVTYANDQDGVEMVYPRTWEVKERPMPDVLVAFLSPKDNALDTFTENVNISTYDMSKQPHSTDEYAKIMVDQLTMLFSDVELVQKTPFPLAGQVGYRMVLNMTGDSPRTIVVYAFTIEKTGYNILYIGTNERYAREWFLLDMMALSLKVKY
jgi:hypothetical protein